MKHLDLFSGIGGFALGLQKVGFKTVAFCEIDKYCQTLLNEKWKGVKIYNDVKEITKERFEADGIQFPEIITGGFPCQPFSVAGKQKGTSDDRHLWPEMFRIIKELKPKWVLAENVRGLINIQDGMVFETVCTDLESEGYEVQTFNIPAVGVGAPHRRERIWIVANSNTGNVEAGCERQRGICEENTKKGQPSNVTSSGETVANASTGRCTLQEEQIQTRWNSFEYQGWWDIEPNVGRVAYGLPGRVHRLKGLGNAIVPQIAQEIGKAIMKDKQ